MPTLFSNKDLLELPIMPIISVTLFGSDVSGVTELLGAKPLIENPSIDLSDSDDESESLTIPVPSFTDSSVKINGATFLFNDESDTADIKDYLKDYLSDPSGLDDVTFFCPKNIDEFREMQKQFLYFTSKSVYRVITNDVKIMEALIGNQLIGIINKNDLPGSSVAVLTELKNEYLKKHIAPEPSRPRSQSSP